MADLEYLVEFGQYQDGKWTAELTLTRDSLEEARKMARAVAAEIRDDGEYYRETNLQLQIRDNQEPSKLYHYVTAQYPDILAPTEPPRGARRSRWLGRDEQI